MHDTTRVCPNCGSTNVGMDNTRLLSRFGLDYSYRCRSCDYAGIFPEVDKEGVAETIAGVKERGPLPDAAGEKSTSRGRLALGAFALLIGIPSSLYATWGTGKLVGLLSLAIGAAIFFEFIQSRA